MKIAIINAKYSPNLGDGAIAECLEAELLKRLPDSHVFSIDVSGSGDYGGSNTMLPGKLQRFIIKLPDALQKAIKDLLRPTMIKLRNVRRWRDQLKGCDAIIIGGGHLLMDVHCYFPTRIAMIIDVAPKATALFVHSVGVSKIFSKKGKALFMKCFNSGDLVSVSVRDDQSRKHWEQNFSCTDAEVVFDPALLAYVTYKSELLKLDEKSKNSSIIAVGIADPSDMASHADDKNQIVTCGFDFYKSLISLHCCPVNFHISFI